MIAIIKDIYQELSNRKRISIIDVFVSLLVIRITDHFVDINTYFSKIFNNKNKFICQLNFKLLVLS